MTLRIIQLGRLSYYKPLFILLQPLAGLGAHRLGEIAERARAIEVQLGRVIIGQDPRKHRILHQIVVAAARQRVQEHQVLEVGDLATLPTLHHRPLANERIEEAAVLLDADGAPLACAAGLGRVAEVGREREQLVAHAVAAGAAEDEQEVAAVVGEDLERDLLQQVAAIVHLLGAEGEQEVKEWEMSKELFELDLSLSILLFTQEGNIKFHISLKIC